MESRAVPPIGNDDQRSLHDFFANAVETSRSSLLEPALGIPIPTMTSGAPLSTCATAFTDVYAGNIFSIAVWNHPICFRYVVSSLANLSLTFIKMGRSFWHF